MTRMLTCQPLTHILPPTLQEKHQGQKVLCQGQVLAVIAAGGDGTRLGFCHPKGCYPITPSTHKTLFERLVERQRYASALYQTPLHLAFMTSETNHEETLDFFHKHQYFGAHRDHLHFFPQDSLPFRNLDNTLLPKKGPSGNGSCLKLLYETSFYQTLVSLGVTCVTFTPIDNPLIDPFDPQLIGRHQTTQSEITIQAIQTLDTQERVGHLVQTPQGIRIIEYTELDTHMSAHERKHFCLANISCFAFSTSLIQTAHAQFASIPLHTHTKTDPITQKPYLKQETFIFDNLPFAKRIEVLLQDRQEIFSPLKNAQGPFSPDTVQHDLIQKDRRHFESVTQRPCPPQLKEVSMEWYYSPPKITPSIQIPDQEYLTLGDLT